jgi:hypothetical protein
MQTVLIRASVMKTPHDWELMAVDSPYQTAIAVQTLLQEGNWMEATQGLSVLIDSMGRSEKRSLKSQLTRLMSHVIKWKCQPERRSASWTITIRDARTEIEDSQEEFPSLNRVYIESIWDKCFSRAIKDAEDEMEKRSSVTSLSWTEVFEQEYTLLD